MKNYKNELLALTKEELVAYIDITASMAEKFESKVAGAKHLTEVNGPDAELPCGRYVEIKTQCYSGNYELRGRGKYGSATMDIYKKKLQKNELTIVSGFDQATGDVLYRFSFDFTAISDRYLANVEDRAARGLGPTNYDTYPAHYMHHKSFKIDFVADPLILFLSCHKFTNKFYKFLLYNAITGKVDTTYQPQLRSPENRTSDLWHSQAQALWAKNASAVDNLELFKEIQDHFKNCKEA